MLNFELSIAQKIAMLAMQLGIIIFAARFCGDMAKKIKMPPVLGELLAGIIIGPYLLGGIPLPFHGMESGLFGFQSSVEIANVGVLENLTFQSYHSSLYAIATIGSVMLLFISGLETDLRMFIRYSLAGTLVGIGGVIFSFAFGAGVGVFMLDLPLMHPTTLFLGILSTATSVGITARILSEQRKIDTPEGVTTLAAAVIDDVLGIICLAVVMGIVSVPDPSCMDWGNIGMITLKCVGFWLIATVIGLLFAGSVAKFLKRFKSASVFAMLSFGLALLVAGIFEQQGLAMIIGAYVTGLSLSKTDISFALQRSLHGVYNFLVPVFFVVMGMLVDIRIFADTEVLKIGVIYSALAIIAKVVGCAIPAWFMNFNYKGALRVGAGMVPRGEVALIIAGIGMTTMFDGKAVLDTRLFGVAIIMTLLTTLLAPPLLVLFLNMKGKGVRKEHKDSSVVHTPFSFNTPVLADFVLRHLEENLKKENYMLSQLDKESGVMQIRKDDLAFALTVDNCDLVFESNPDEVPFIKALMFETIVSLHLELEHLKNIAKPDEIRGELLAAEEFAPENGHHHQLMLDKGLSRHTIIMDLSARDKYGVIRELTSLLAKNGLIDDAAAVAQEVMTRENVASTCIQNGIALPHARTNAVKRQVIAVGIRREGYEFDSLDGKPTRIFVLCLSPRDSNGPHIECLATIASILSTPDKIQKIINARSPGEVYDIFRR